MAQNHTRSSSGLAGELVVEHSVAVQIAGYVALLVFVGAGALMTVVSYWADGIVARTGSRVHLSNLWGRLRVYAPLLGALWLLAAMNRLDWRRADDGATLSLSLLVLNAAVWTVALNEVLAYYLGYDGAPTHWTAYDTSTLVVRAIVCAMAAVSLSTEAARFMALVLVLPLCAVLQWAACFEAPSARTLLQPEVDWRQAQRTLVATRPRIAAAALFCLGLATLVLEMLTPSYGNVVGVGAAAWFALAEHCALGALLLYLAAGAGDLPPPASSSSPSPSQSKRQPDIEAQIEALSLTPAAAPPPPFGGTVTQRQERGTLLAGIGDDDDEFVSDAYTSPPALSAHPPSYSTTGGGGGRM